MKFPTILKYFAMFMMVFCAVFFVKGLVDKDYVSAVIQAVCLYINCNTYLNAKGREQSQKELP